MLKPKASLTAHVIMQRVPSKGLAGYISLHTYFQVKGDASCEVKVQNPVDSALHNIPKASRN